MAKIRMKKKDTCGRPITRNYHQSVLRKGAYKYLGNTQVKVEKDHGNGLVTVNVKGKWVVVKRNNLR